MTFDFTTAIIQATVAVAGAPGGATTAGTGILVSDPTPDGTPRVVLVTARHVIQNIVQNSGGQAGAAQVQLGLHLKNPDGSWRKEWRAEPVQDGERLLWARHPVYDVAVLPVAVPPEVAAAAIPVSWFADADTFARQDVEPGDALEVLGYPAGFASDARGFGILRVGHLASYPLTPESEGTFLVDFPVASGNSGGPVFTSRRTGRGPQAVGAQGPLPDEFIAGIVAQQIVPGGQSINLGLVVHALYVRQTLQQLDQPASPPPILAPSTNAAPVS
ncbi:MAG: trypsin-like peptidase domain-containing protein [Caulobacteraceae bacterium]